MNINAAFEKYYKTQGIVPDNHWDLFMTKMKRKLPISFRINGSRIEAKKLLEILQRDFLNVILNVNRRNKEKTETLRCLPFYPDCLAWQLYWTGRKLHKLLVTEEFCGNVIRQEVATMIPPLLLDMKPSHKVLDMCAGLNTFQLIEMLHSGEENGLPEGFIVTNSLKISHCHRIIDQSKFRNSPCTLITNHDASIFPNLMLAKSDDAKEDLKFDRILADVPSSEDGAIRGNFIKWRTWSPADGNDLHEVQYRIARRGLVLLTVGGRMVYSTRSLNPIENEAVLHRLLLETKDSVRIVDGRDLVPGLVCDPGLSRWFLASKDLKYYLSWERDLPTEVQPHMFPPKSKDAAKFHFERCMRILPHHQDTSGFFMAILEKVKPLPWESNQNESEAKENSEELNLNEEADHQKLNLDEEADCQELNLDEEADCQKLNLDEEADHQKLNLDEEADCQELKLDEEADCQELNLDQEADYEELNLDQEADYEELNLDEEAEDDEEVEEDKDHQFVCRKRKLSDDQDPSDLNMELKRAKEELSEDRFVFLKDDQEGIYWTSIKDFYGITDEFDANLLVRDTRGRKRGIHYMSPEIRNVFVSNKDEMKLISIGVRAFMLKKKQKSIPRYRLTFNGLEFLINYVSDTKKFPINRKDLVTILLNMDARRAGETVTLDPDTEEYLKALKSENRILIYEEMGTDYENPLKLNIIGFEDTIPPKIRKPAYHVKHYLCLLGDDCSMFDRRKYKHRAKGTEVEIQPEMIDEVNIDEDSSD
ncbi:tRNA (cytosine(34)-C(5))-methyltransferase isoform X2 [Megalopta genalis]|uniref:tRNA (cytosine(34)-C(5))-methyltransferase isoform X2 n=1 Tax=Megalopta genalis TaxID=115081 RepID=UPI003FD62119